MKTKQLTLILIVCNAFFASSSFAQGEWQLQNPIPAFEDLLDVYCLPSSSTVWVCGNYGKILKTVDGGNTWTELNSGTDVDLNSIFFRNANLGWACGESGTLLKTTNGGVTWNLQTIGTTNELEDVFFYSDFTGYVVGRSGVMFKSYDGGSYWSPRTSGTTMTLYSICFKTSSIGWATGYYGTILKTTNGGSTWTAQTSPVSTGLYDCSFYNSSIGYISGNEGTILKTTNGGVTWVKQNSGNTNRAIYCIHSYSTSYAWAGDMNGYHYRTTNGGSTWTSETIDPSINIYGIHFNNSTTGQFVGRKGTIYKTTDKGATYFSQSSGLTNDIHDVYFKDVNNGWAVGNPGIILKTANGGKTWTQVPLSSTYTLKSIDFYNSSYGYIAGTGGRVYRTTNGGDSWFEIATGVNESYYDVDFPYYTIGYVVGFMGSIRKTSNSGATWVAQTSGTISHLHACHFYNYLTGWICGANGTILKTTNAGTNWVPQTSGTTAWLYDICFYNSTLGWAFGSSGTILKTTNGGSTWVAQTSGTSELLISGKIISSTTLLAVGRHGDIYKTTNGGTSWTKQLGSYTSKNMVDSYFTDLNNGWCVGPGGIIIKYTNNTPTSQATYVTASNVTYEEMDVHWNRGNGNQSALFIKEGSAGSCVPDVNVTYMPNSTFGLGDQVGNSGWYCVYNGSGNSASIDGLQPNTSYRIHACEYNFSPEFVHYSSSTATYNPRTSSTAIAPPQVTSNPSNRSLCEGLNTSFSASASGLGLSYQWQENAGAGYLNISNGGAYSGTTTSTLSLNNIPADINANTYRCVVTNTSGSATSGEALLAVSPLPIFPADISGDDIVCQNSAYTFFVPPVAYADNYQWNFPAGFSGSSATNTINLSTASNASAGAISVFGTNSCGSGPSKDFIVSVKALPANAVAITGLDEVCSGSVNIGYNTPVITGADTYVWSLPLEATGTSSSNSIMVSYGSTPLTDQISVKGHNMCGDGVESTLPVIVSSIPSASGAISGSSNVCKNQTDVSYTVNAIPGASTYSWTLPPGVSGANSSNSVSLSYGTDAFSGDIKVAGVNSCGTGAEIAFPVLVNSVPENAGVISGPSSVCKEQTNVLYTIPISEGASSYHWELPDGTEETTVTSKIVVNYSASSVSGNIYVTPQNSCGGGNGSSIFVVVADPPAPSITVSGSEEFCDGQSVELSIAPVSGMNYQWLLNGGTVGENASKYEANESGDYTVKVINMGGCFSTSVNTVSLTVHPSPQTPTLNLSGPTTFCENQSLTLGVSNPGSYSYQWINQFGEIASETSDSISIDASGRYQLRVRNEGMCQSFSEEISVTVNTYPVTPVIQTENYQMDACQDDDPVLLSVENVEVGTAYLWRRNGSVIAGENESTLRGFLEEGDYNIEAIRNECGTESEKLTIRYGAKPEKPEIIAEGPAIWYLACSNDSATDYKWYLDGIEIEDADAYLFVAGTQEGKYEVSISREGSCYSMSDPMWLPLGTGIDLDPWKNLKIYPNPTPGLFTLDMDNHIMGELIIDIFGESGAKIINIKFHKETAHFRTQIDLSEQPPAAYLISLMLEQYRANRTLIVE